MDHMLLVAACWLCGRQIIACPDCVTSLPIDPHTGLPPDVHCTPEGEYIRQEPDQTAVARAKREPLCDHCAARGGQTETWQQRHKRHLASEMP